MKTNAKYGSARREAFIVFRRCVNRFVKNKKNKKKTKNKTKRNKRNNLLKFLEKLNAYLPSKVINSSAKTLAIISSEISRNGPFDYANNFDGNNLNISN